MDKHFRLRALTLAVSGALILAACGGGEGSASALSGTAAEGLAIANATLTARDAVGNTAAPPPMPAATTASTPPASAFR